MLDLTFPRDLLMTGAIFGVVTFVWTGWAQERPPHWAWRIALGIMGLAGCALAGLSIPTVIRNWTAPTAIVFGGPSWTFYLIMCALEVIGIAVGAIIVARKKRSDLIPPIALAVVGIHFFPLAPVFGQPILYVVAALVTIAAVVAAFPPLKIAARSFWCGILAGPVFLTAGAVSFFAANSVL